jgi:hypothetical protein
MKKRRGKESHKNKERDYEYVASSEEMMFRVKQGSLQSLDKE